MATLLEMATKIVTASAKLNPMSSDEMMYGIQKVYALLKKLEAGENVEPATQEAAEPAKPSITGKQSIKQNEIVCMLCGKSMKTLTRHLTKEHDLKPGQYRKQFGIPATVPLAAKSVSKRRKEIAATMNLAGNLEKARAARAANIQAKKEKPAKAAKPAKPAKAAKAAPKARKKAAKKTEE